MARPDAPRRATANRYEAYLRAEGIPPLEAMSAFTKGEPTKVHHLNRDPEFLIELPERIEIHRIIVDAQRLR